MKTNKFITTIPKNKIKKFCQHWKIHELALFGSVLHDNFGTNSDIDVLITFAGDADFGLLDHIQMQQELKTILQRNVDLISKRALVHSENWLRREEILNTSQIIFLE